MRTVLLTLLLLAGAAWALEVEGAATPTEGSPPLTVHFRSTAREAGGKLSHRWDFDDGDGSQSTEANPSHTYRRVGNFRPSLELSDGKSRAIWSQTVKVALRAAVEVAPEGGAHELRFEARKGQALRIQLDAPAPMEPYGYLESASGGDYRPAQQTYTWEGTAPDSGEYVLTVFDGANQGGRVNVLVEEP